MNAGVTVKPAENRRNKNLLDTVWGMVYSEFMVVKRISRRRPKRAVGCSDHPWNSPIESEAGMKLNVGGIDRVVRVLAGLALIGLTLSGMIGVWGWIGVVPLATGLFSFCPLYTLLGINSCPAKAKG
jgi:hypothetical protein